MKKKSTCLFVLSIVVTVMLVSVQVVVAQNANSSTATNTNTATKKPSRHKPKAKTAAAATEATATETTAAPQKAAKPKPKRRTGRCDPMQQEQADLSGTYTGRAKHGDRVLNGTLTITGNDFTMTSDSETHSGKIVAVTTCGYTAVAMSMPGEGGQMSIHSLRARKMGDRLTLTSVPGEPEKISFTTGGTGMAGKTRRHKTMKPKAAAPAATPTTPPQ